MTQFKDAIFVGIDVSKAWLDIAIRDKVLRCDNTLEAIQRIIDTKIKPLCPALCVVEPTGKYERLLVNLLQQADLPIHIAHSSRVRRFAEVTGILAKTDKIDALLLASYGAFVGQKAIAKAKSDQKLYLQDLQARFRQLKGMIQAERCRLQSKCDPRLHKNIEDHLAFLQQQQKETLEEIAKLIAADPVLSQSAKLLRSYKGVGELTANAMLSELPELGQISHKKIASLVGVAPITKQSGKKQSAARINKGRSQVRHVLYMTALLASRHNPLMKAFYQKLLAKGKPHKVALVAVMRRTLTILNAIIKSQQPWKGASYAC